MTKHEAFEHLDWAQASLQEAMEDIKEVMSNGKEFLEGEDADWLYFAVEHADDAKHAILNRGLYKRLMMEYEYELD